MTLIKRIALLSFFSTLCIVTVLMISLYSLRMMNANFNAVIELDVTQAIIGKDIKISLLEMHRAEKSLILSISQEDMRKYNKDFLTAKKHIQDNIINLILVADKENLSNLEAVKTLYNKYVDVYEDIYNLTIQNSNQKAKALLIDGDASNKIKLLDELTVELALTISNELLGINLDPNKKTTASKQQALILLSRIESNTLRSVRDAGRSILLVDSDEIKKMADSSNFFLSQVKLDIKKLRAITEQNKSIKIEQIINVLKDYEEVQSDALRLAILNSNQKQPVFLQLSLKNIFLNQVS